MDDKTKTIIQNHINDNEVCLFMKGKAFSNELKLARDKWSFDCDVVQSKTSADGAVLIIRNVCRANK